jgi:hypothetical protein
MSGGPEPAEGGILFRYKNANAKKVNLVGDFNDWSPTSDPMSDENGDGEFTLFYPLGVGTYAYKFLVDGKNWVSDPGNPSSEPDGFNGRNSIVKVILPNPLILLPLGRPAGTIAAARGSLIADSTAKLFPGPHLAPTLPSTVRVIWASGCSRAHCSIGISSSRLFRQGRDSSSPFDTEMAAHSGRADRALGRGVGIGHCRRRERHRIHHADRTRGRGIHRQVEHPVHR